MPAGKLGRGGTPRDPPHGFVQAQSLALSPPPLPSALEKRSPTLSSRKRTGNGGFRLRDRGREQEAGKQAGKPGPSRRTLVPRETRHWSCQPESIARYFPACPAPGVFAGSYPLESLPSFHASPPEELMELEAAVEVPQGEQHCPLPLSPGDTTGGRKQGQRPWEPAGRDGRSRYRPGQPPGAPEEPPELSQRPDTGSPWPFPRRRARPAEHRPPRAIIACPHDTQRAVADSRVLSPAPTPVSCRGQRLLAFRGHCPRVPPPPPALVARLRHTALLLSVTSPNY
ncbi:basic salivary proline-rich protein 4-like [Indicator indicator]|uniref:basic salivary proline-rich protein 4-like n=1 Tax=Indicator indicator TaxID=1002788 RepID=UPI0023E02A7D|nr:basic salivary proline-rich protein 4-like [Indicator indicator]